MWLLEELKNRNRDYENIAIIHRNRRISYAELWGMSESIGAWMEKHLTTDAPILIYGDKDIEIVAIMIAALKTGRAYVPMDIAFPSGRVQKIATITQGEVLFNVSDAKLDVSTDGLRYCIDKVALIDIISNVPPEDIDESKWVEGDDNCYIIFTSGSTGEPKGVQISKNNLVNFATGFYKCADVEGNVALSQVAYSFDLSVIPLYVYLPSGKALYCVDKSMIADFKTLFDCLRTSNISAWVATPSFTEMCISYDGFDRSLLPHLEKMAFVGETLTKKLVLSLWERFPGIKIINGYGPTEATCALTYCEITNDMIYDTEHSLPVGKFIDGVEYNIEHEDDTDIFDGEIKKGELIVSGKSVSKGYFNNECVSAKSFFHLKNSPYMSYRTGDVVYEHDGFLYFCGRKDFQIKLNGYRIELEDIAENINKIDGVSSSIVIPVYEDGKIKNLAAFVKLKSVSSGGGSVLSIRKGLQKLVPSYMIPKKIIIVEEYPLNVNGKIDRKALAEAYL